MPRKEIPPGRKTAYYLGMIVSIVGVLLFLSVFVTGIARFGDFDNFASRSRNEGMRAFVGIALIVVGAILRNVGVRGLAGSGVIIDPEKAREEVEPWSRMAGGMAGDALDEAGIDLNRLKGDSEMPFDEKLRRLHQLREDGILSEEEYDREKKEILDAN